MYPLPSAVPSSWEALKYLLNKWVNGDSVETSEAQKCIKANPKYSKLFNSLSWSDDLSNSFLQCCRLCSLEVDTEDVVWGIIYLSGVSTLKRRGLEAVGSRWRVVGAQQSSRASIGCYNCHALGRSGWVSVSPLTLSVPVSHLMQAALGRAWAWTGWLSVANAGKGLTAACWWLYS